MTENDDYPLFIEYPELKEKLPRKKLIRKTPVEKLEKLGAEIGLKNIWIKRDDLTTEAYGGNKPRKLEFVYAEAINKGKTEIVTPGGIGSNHALATCIFCKQFNLKPVLTLFHQPVTEDVKKKLLYYLYYGAEILYTKSQVGGLLNYMIKQKLKRKNAYFLYAGGTTPFTNFGHVNAAFELKEQIQNNEMEEPDTIFVTIGSVGTMAGLEAGLRLSGLKTKLIGITVVPSIAFILYLLSAKRAVKTQANKTIKIVKKHVPKMRNFIYSPNFLVNADYYGGEYGGVTDKGLEAIKILKETENIQLETTYTGKTFAALLDYAKKNPDEKILFWNTYNSIELPDIKDKVNYKDLPSDLHYIYEK